MRPVVVGLALLAAGAVSASALGGQPTPDPAPTKTAPPKTTKTTAPSKTTKTTAPATVSPAVSRPSSHATTTSRPSSTPATAHASTTGATSAHAKTTTAATQPAAKPNPKPKPKPTVVLKRKAKPKAKLVPRAKAPPATHVSTPRTSPAIVLASPSHGGGSGLARTLLLTLAILFLVLAAVPWQQVFQYHVRPDQVLLLRVAFSVISLSVGVGYVIASYVNGGT